MDQLAEIACLSPYHFARTFKVAIGVAPHGYIGALRIERAKNQLARDEHSLAQIALMSGFSCQTTFNRGFLKATGMTPGSFRRPARESER